MQRGFVYVTRSASRTFAKVDFRSVPTEHKGQLFFGPCKESMRPRVQEGDWIFGVSPSGTSPRRMVFAMQVAERISYSEAYARYPELRGPEGPIHVRPRVAGGAFPHSAYEHIPGSAHHDRWPADIATPQHDAFLVGLPASGWQGRWLGKAGPAIDDEVLELLKRMPVFGQHGLLASGNPDATLSAPICHGRLYTGLHLETDAPAILLTALEQRVGELQDAASSHPKRFGRNAGSPCARVATSSRRTTC